MGFSRKNPHTPDGWDSGNSPGGEGGGVKDPGNPGRRGGRVELEKCRGHLNLLYI